MRIQCSVGLFALCATAFGAEPAFEVASLKHTGNYMEGGRREGDRFYTRPIRSLEYKGVKLSGECPLYGIFQFALAPLLKPWQFEGPDWIGQEYFEIEAIAPAGTTVDGARAMVRTLLQQRLGLQYRMVDRETSVYALVRGTGELKLERATEPEPNLGAMTMGAFVKKSASMADFAGFLGNLADHEVVDRTGVAGAYRFDVNWTREIVGTRQEYGPHGDPAIVSVGLKKLGLKLEARKEARRIVVVDRVNKTPTPN